MICLKDVSKIYNQGKAKRDAGATACDTYNKKGRYGCHYRTVWLWKIHIAAHYSGH